MHAPLSSTSRLSFSGDGTVEGYASLFGEIDQARDMVMPGAFTQTLKQRGLRKIPMLFQHDPAEPVGIWLELREDFRGLWARGKLIPDVMRARELLALYSQADELIAQQNRELLERIKELSERMDLSYTQGNMRELLDRSRDVGVAGGMPLLISCDDEKVAQIFERLGQLHIGHGRSIQGDSLS